MITPFITPITAKPIVSLCNTQNRKNHSDPSSASKRLTGGQFASVSSNMENKHLVNDPKYSNIFLLGVFNGSLCWTRLHRFTVISSCAHAAILCDSSPFDKNVMVNYLVLKCRLVVDVDVLIILNGLERCKTLKHSMNIDFDKADARWTFPHLAHPQYSWFAMSFPRICAMRAPSSLKVIHTMLRGQFYSEPLVNLPLGCWIPTTTDLFPKWRQNNI